MHVSAKWLARRLSRRQEPEIGSDLKLIVGLGNPGARYSKSRHNVGFIVLDRFAESHRLTFSRRRFNSLVAAGNVQTCSVLLAKPQTFMNLSGNAVDKFVSYHRIPNDDIIVVYDDIDLPLGKIRIRPGGSAGGHHGMESVIAALGRSDFARLRIGISRADSRDQVNHVLGSMTEDEIIVLDRTFARAVEALDAWVTRGVENAMNAFNP